MNPLHRLCCIVCASGLLTNFVGCGTKEDYHPISGTVLLDNVPLKKGVVTLYPTGPGTTVGGEIIDGHFSLPRDRGPTPGEYRVEIVAFKPSGKKEFDVDLNAQVDIEIQYLPEKYNTKSKLVCKVEAKGENKFEFKLALK